MYFQTKHIILLASANLGFRSKLQAKPFLSADLRSISNH